MKKRFWTYSTGTCNFIRHLKVRRSVDASVDGSLLYSSIAKYEVAERSIGLRSNLRGREQHPVGFTSSVLDIDNLIHQPSGGLWRTIVELGSGLIDHIQKMTMAAMAMADMKVCAQRS
jgi:hypothetical protein